MKNVTIKSKVSIGICIGVILIAIAANVVKNGTTDTSTMTVKNMTVTTTPVIQVSKSEKQKPKVIKLPLAPPSPYFASEIGIK